MGEQLCMSARLAHDHALAFAIVFVDPDGCVGRCLAQVRGPRAHGAPAASGPGLPSYAEAWPREVPFAPAAANGLLQSLAIHDPLAIPRVACSIWEKGSCSPYLADGGLVLELSRVKWLRERVAA